MRKKTIIKVVVAVIIISGSLSYFIYQAMQSSWSYYYSLDEFAARKASIGNRNLRLAGRVKKDTVQKNIEKMTLSFILADSNAALPVKYKGPVPDNFTEGIEIVVEGNLTPEEIFRAKKIITRCESKYRSRIE